MRGQVIGVVVASKSTKFPVGSLATGITGWTELAVAKDKELQKIVLPKNGRLTDALSVLGMLFTICNPLAAELRLFAGDDVNRSAHQARQASPPTSA